MAQSTFSVGGLATGMDTQSMIDKLVELESRPLTILQQRQAAFKSQVSALGDLASKLGALRTAANNLGTGGALALTATSTNTAFSAVPGSSATAGTYDLQVSALASTAKWRSNAVSSTDTLKPGTLRLTVGLDADGNPLVFPPASTDPITIGPATTLEDLAVAIRRSGAPVSASVLDDGVHEYLSVTANATGYSGTDPTAALRLDYSYPDPGAAGIDLTANAWHQDASNASFTIDDLAFTRSSNTVTDALPGTTLTLKKAGGPEETLSLSTDAAGTQAKLQTFVDAYNAVMAAVQKQTNVSQGTDRASTLAGDSAVRGLQSDLQSLVSVQIPGLGTVRSLADLGIQTQRDGTLKLDATVLAAAIGRDPTAVNAIFADTTDGIAKLTSAKVQLYSATGNGLLSLRKDGLQDQIRDMDDQAASLQARIDAYREGLVKQFTAMENIVGQLKSIGTFLTTQDNLNAKG